MIEIIDFNGGINGIPQFVDREKMWSELKVSACERPYPNTMKYIEELRSLYSNGSVRYSSFNVEFHPVFDWYASRGQFYEIGFFGKFWSVPAVHKLMPESLSDFNCYSRDIFVWSSPYLLGGSLARALRSGGAYREHSKKSVDAKISGEAAAMELVQNDYDNVELFESHTPWSAFFNNLIWDHTWIIVDKGRRIIHLIIGTDTD